MSLFNDKGTDVGQGLVCHFRPLKKSRVTVSNEVLAMARPMSPFMGSYPRKCNTDEQKLKFLRDKYFNQGVTLQVYTELVEGLNIEDTVKFKDIMIAMRGAQ